MGDEKPSTFLQRLRNLAAGQCNDHVIKSLFLEQLPESVRGILAMSDQGDLTKLATQADKVVEACRPQIFAVNHGESSRDTSNVVRKPNPKEAPPNGNERTAADNEIHELRAAVDALTRKFDKFERRHRTASTDRGKSSRSVSPASHSDRMSEYCYYHNKFGFGAKKCRDPCSWKQQHQKEN